mgnify:CR=1 FL=1
MKGLNFSDWITSTAAAIGALSLIFSAYQYFRQRYEQKVAFTLDRCRNIALAYRNPSVMQYLRDLRSLEGSSSEERDSKIGSLLYERRGTPLTSDFASFIDELEYFAVLARNGSIYLQLALAESAEWITDCYQELKPLIAHQLKEPSTMYLNFVWLAERAQRAISSRSWRRQHMWKPRRRD